MEGTTCPKCGTGRMSGPAYRSGYGAGGERLIYACLKCGYKTSTPTADSPFRDEFPMPKGAGKAS
ncbi:MAG: hypothetical protein F4Y03_16120 [Alphaproteobacteria bacterium]|nr:hypothetical protein [Alphaproteobacteria bacterium]